jgi:hypothetical protein
MLKFFNAKDPLKKDVAQQFSFLQNLTFLVVKNHFIIQFVESTWLKHLVMHFMSKSCVSIKKNVFTKGFGSFSGEDKTKICFA